MKFNSFMGEAIKEARKALEFDEVPVGAVMVHSKTGEIIARAHNRNISDQDPTAHSEVLAIRAACKSLNSHRLDECDIYVTLEPCPMCASVISLARIRRVYYGAEDKKSGGIDNGPQIYKQKSCHHKPEIYGDIDSKECSKILKDFFAKKR
jgi:tRNA(adenine34) deaminase